jgi:trigger factor
MLKNIFDQAYEKLASTVSIEGFRPGKAPRLMTLEAIGQNRYTSYALDLALPMVYSEAIKQEKLIPVASPKVDLKQFVEEKDFEFIAEVDVLPEIKLGDYKKIKIKHKAEPIDAKKKILIKLLKTSASTSKIYCHI